MQNALIMIYYAVNNGDFKTAQHYARRYETNLKTPVDDDVLTAYGFTCTAGTWARGCVRIENFLGHYNQMSGGQIVTECDNVAQLENVLFVAGIE